MGNAVYGGIGRGVMKFFHREEVVISKARVGDTLRELRRFAYARNEVVEELKHLYSQAVDAKTTEVVINMLKKHYSYDEIVELAGTTKDNIIRIAQLNKLAYN